MGPRYLAFWGFGNLAAGKQQLTPHHTLTIKFPAEIHKLTIWPCMVNLVSISKALLKHHQVNMVGKTHPFFVQEDMYKLEFTDQRLSFVGTKGQIWFSIKRCLHFGILAP